MSAELLPCAMCGGLPEKREVKFWTGRHNDVIRVEFHHHCDGLTARQRAFTNVSGVTEDEAVSAWNRRQPPAERAALSDAEIDRAIEAWIAQEGFIPLGADRATDRARMRAAIKGTKSHD